VEPAWPKRARDEGGDGEGKQARERRHQQEGESNASAGMKQLWFAPVTRRQGKLAKTEKTGGYKTEKELKATGLFE